MPFRTYLPGAILAATATSVSAGGFYSISNGELQRPTGYRDWVFVGTPGTPNGMNDGKAGRIQLVDATF